MERRLVAASAKLRRAATIVGMERLQHLNQDAWYRAGGCPRSSDSLVSVESSLNCGYLSEQDRLTRRRWRQWTEGRLDAFP
jgi:hypothetical protein